MSKQFTVITKDGSKWLQPINVPYPNADEYEDGKEPHPIFARADAIIYEERTRPVPYIGDRPEGTLLDETEVRAIRQYKNRLGRSPSDWVTVGVDQCQNAHPISFRTAYTDAEPCIDPLAPYQVTVTVQIDQFDNVTLTCPAGHTFSAKSEGLSDFFDRSHFE